MSEQLRLPCTLHGRYDEHLFTEYDGSTDRVEVKTCPGGHPVEAEKAWVCLSSRQLDGCTGPLFGDMGEAHKDCGERFLIPLSNTETTK